MDFAAADHRPHRTPARRDPPPRHARRGHASSGPSPPRPTRRRVRSAKGAQGLSAVTLLKTSMQRSQGLPVGLCNLPPRRRNRAKPSQTEPNRAKPRPLNRQVSDKSRPACLEMTRNGQERDSLTLFCSLGQAWGTAQPAGRMCCRRTLLTADPEVAIAWAIKRRTSM
jgi:hypothetical protein